MPRNTKNFAQLLLPEESGYLKLDKKDGVLSQEEIIKHVDVTSAQKRFELHLDFGPYKCKYFNNGRKLLLGGEKGHIAVLDPLTKILVCEFNCKKLIKDVCWLHMPDLFSVADEDFVRIYDKNGIEVNYLKHITKPKLLEFLDYHFLLVTANDYYFTYTDTSTGKLISSIKSNKFITSLSKNAHNGIIITGHSNGTLSMWTPNMDTPLVKMLAHPAAIREATVTIDGNKLITCSVDRQIKIWDMRSFKSLHTIHTSSPSQCLAVSQKNLIAVGCGSVVDIYENTKYKKLSSKPYLQHHCDTFIKNLDFCNYEDILGIGHASGFSSIIVPGSGEANFDAFESNPFMNTAQKREMEVKKLLDKIQPDLITLDPQKLAQRYKDPQSISQEKEIKKKFKRKISRKSSNKFTKKSKKRKANDPSN